MTSAAETKKRPKIGLVLSGGGALGLAHIEVIRKLEEKGIRPDYIVGTSMGSIVGGLYAIGYTPDQMEELVKNIDWDEILSNQISLNYVTVEQKPYYNRFMFEFPLGESGLEIPSGVINSQSMLNVLINATWSATRYEDFDEFPIPFRCVATDVSTGQEVIFKDGPLYLAMRASMAIPTAFTPVDYDSTLLVDGGVINNFPVDIALKMGAEIVIGSDVSTGIQNAYKVKSLLGILYQISMFSSLTKMDEHIAQCDIYFDHNLDSYSAADFDKYEIILDSGRAVAERYSEELDSLKSLYRINDEIPKISLTNTDDTLSVREVYAYDKKGELSSNLRKITRLESGDRLTLKEIEYRTKLAYGTGYYNQIQWWGEPSLLDSSSYYFDYHFDKAPNSTIKASLHFDNIFGIGFMLNYTENDLLGRRSRLIAELDLCANFKGHLNYLKYFGKRKKFGFMFDYRFFNYENNTYVKGEKTGVQRENDHFFEVSVQNVNSLQSYVQMGYVLHLEGEKLIVGDNLVQNSRATALNNNIFIQLNTNNLNTQYYPTKGRKVNLRGDLLLPRNLSIRFPDGTDSLAFNIDGKPYFGSEQDVNDSLNKLIPKSPYFQISGSMDRYFELTKRWQIFGKIRGGYTITFEDDPESKSYQSFRLGGEFQLNYRDFRINGLRYSEYSASNFVAVSLGPQFSPLKRLYFIGELGALYINDVGINLRSIRVPSFSDINESILITYGVKLAYSSPLGPIEIGVSSNDLDNVYRLYFAFGYIF
jgi:NTE family protein